MSRQAEMDLAEITGFIALSDPARAFEFEEALLSTRVALGVRRWHMPSEEICEREFGRVLTAPT